MMPCDCKRSLGKVSLQHSHKAEGGGKHCRKNHPPTGEASAEVSIGRKGQGVYSAHEHSSGMELTDHPHEVLRDPRASVLPRAGAQTVCAQRITKAPTYYERSYGESNWLF